MRSRRLIAAVALTCTTGCYTLQPVVGSALADGTEVGFDITDQGRIALGGAMGPAIRRIEGRLVRRDGTDVLVAVKSVRFLAGGEQAWSGESVRLRPEHIGTAYVRRLSKARTIALTALLAGATAVIVTRSVNGGGTPGTTPPVDSGGNTNRGRRP